MNIQKLLKRNKLIRQTAYAVYFMFSKKIDSFKGSDHYWKNRYAKGKNSGPGSYGQLAQFKAQTLNNFILTNGIKEVIEFGCGDGNQLALSEYPDYTGLDISNDALNICRAKYKGDKNKKFIDMNEWSDSLKAELCLSLDVLYHLTEEVTFKDYLEKLFKSSTKYVIIYSSNTNTQFNYQLPHIIHRRFTDYIESNFDTWRLIEKIDNIYPYNGDDESTSFADFYIFQRIDR